MSLAKSVMGSLIIRCQYTRTIAEDSSAGKSISKTIKSEIPEKQMQVPPKRNPMRQALRKHRRKTAADEKNKTVKTDISKGSIEASIALKKSGLTKGVIESNETKESPEEPAANKPRNNPANQRQNSFSPDIVFLSK